MNNEPQLCLTLGHLNNLLTLLEQQTGEKITAERFLELLGGNNYETDSQDLKIT